MKDKKKEGIKNFMAFFCKIYDKSQMSAEKHFHPNPDFYRRWVTK